MASPADAIAQVNGLADPPSPPSQSQSDPSQPAGPTAKRKRESSDDGSQDLDQPDEVKPAINDGQLLRDEKTLIRHYYDVLRRYATFFNFQIQFFYRHFRPGNPITHQHHRMLTLDFLDMIPFLPYSSDHFQIHLPPTSRSPRDRSLTMMAPIPRVSRPRSTKTPINFSISSFWILSKLLKIKPPSCALLHPLTVPSMMRRLLSS